MRSSLSWKEAFSFPLSTAEARNDLLIGGSLLFLLIPGWILNLGHRLEVVHCLANNTPPYYRGYRPWSKTFLRGLTAFFAIALYLSPAIIFGALSFLIKCSAGALFCSLTAGILFLLAVFILPGGMTYNAAFQDMSFLYRPDKALRRALAGGRDYLFAWIIALSAIFISFLGLLALGVGFFYTSVWAWQVVGYSFSRALVLHQRPAMGLSQT